MTSVLCVRLTMPPSGNHLYYNKPHGGRGLTTAGRSWRRRAADLVHETTGIALSAPLDENERYRVRLTFYFKEVENAGWYQRWASDSRPGAKKPHKKGERKAKSRWKMVDLDNRLKVTLDALTKATGVDDAAHHSLIVEKAVVPIKEMDPFVVAEMEIY